MKRELIISASIIILLVAISLLSLTSYMAGNNIEQQTITTPVTLHLELYSHSKSRSIHPMELFKGTLIFMDGFESYMPKYPPPNWRTRNTIVTEEDSYNRGLDNLHSLKISNGYAYKTLYLGESNSLNPIGGIGVSAAYKVVKGELLIRISTGNDVIAEISIGDKFIVNSQVIDKSSRDVWQIFGVLFLPRDGSLYVWRRGGFFKLGRLGVKYNGYIMIRFEAVESYIDSVVLRVIPPMSKASNIVDPLFSPIVDLSTNPSGDKLALLSAWGFVGIYSRDWRLLENYILDTAGIRYGYLEWISEDIVLVYTVTPPMNECGKRYGEIHVFNTRTDAENNVLLPDNTYMISYTSSNKYLLLYYIVMNTKIEAASIQYILLNKTTLRIVDQGSLLDFKEPEILTPILRRTYSNQLVVVDESLRAYIPAVMHVSYYYKGYREEEFSGLYMYSINVYTGKPVWITEILPPNIKAETMFINKLTDKTLLLIYYTVTPSSKQKYVTHICLINITNGSILWSIDVDDEILSPIYTYRILDAHLLNSTIYIVTNRGILSIDYKSGNLLWSQNTISSMNNIIKSITLNNNILLIGSNGESYIVVNNTLKHYRAFTEPFYGYKLKEPLIHYDSFKKKFYICSNGLLYVLDNEEDIREIYGLPNTSPSNIVYGKESITLFYKGYRPDIIGKGLIINIDYEKNTIQYLLPRDLGLLEINGLLYGEKDIIVYGINDTDSLIIWYDYNFVETNRIFLNDSKIENIYLTSNGYIYYIREYDNQYILGKASSSGKLWEKQLPLDKKNVFGNDLSVYEDTVLVTQITRYSSKWIFLVFNGSGEKLSNFTIDLSLLPQNRFYTLLIRDGVAILGINRGYNAVIHIYDLSGEPIYNKTILHSGVISPYEFRVIDDKIYVALVTYNPSSRNYQYYVCLMNPSNGELLGVFITGTPVDAIVYNDQLYVLNYRWYEEFYTLYVDLERIARRDSFIDFIESRTYILFGLPEHLVLGKTVVSEQIQTKGLLQLFIGVSRILENQVLVYTHRGFFSISLLDPPIIYVKDVHEYGNETIYDVEVYNPSPVTPTPYPNTISFVYDDYKYCEAEIKGWHNREQYLGDTYTLLASRLSPVIKEFYVRDELGRSYDVYIAGTPIDFYLELWDRGSVVDEVSVYVNDKYVGSGWNISFTVNGSAPFVLKVFISDLSGNELAFSKTLYINEIGSGGGGS